MSAIASHFQTLGNKYGIMGSVFPSKPRFCGRQPVAVSEEYDNALMAVPGVYWQAGQSTLTPVIESVCDGEFPVLDLMSFSNGGFGPLLYVTGAYQSMCTILLYYNEKPKACVSGVWQTRSNRRKDNGFFYTRDTIMCSQHKVATWPSMQHTQFDRLGATMSKPKRDALPRKCCSAMCPDSSPPYVPFAYLVYGANMCKTCWQRNMSKDPSLGEAVSSRTVKDYVASLHLKPAQLIFDKLRRLRRGHLVAIMDDKIRLDLADSTQLLVHSTAMSCEFVHFRHIWNVRKKALNVLPAYFTGGNVGRFYLSHEGRPHMKRLKHVNIAMETIIEQADAWTNTGVFRLNFPRTSHIDFKREFLPYLTITGDDETYVLQPWHMFARDAHTHVCVQADAIRVLAALKSGALKLVIEPNPPVDVPDIMPPITPKAQRHSCRTFVLFTQTDADVLPPRRLLEGEYLTWGYLAQTLATYQHLCATHPNAGVATTPLTLRVAGSYLRALQGVTYQHRAGVPPIRYGGVFQNLIEHSMGALHGAVTVKYTAQHNVALQYSASPIADMLAISIRAERECGNDVWTVEAKRRLLDVCEQAGIPAVDAMSNAADAYTMDANVLDVVARIKVQDEATLASSTTSKFILDNLKNKLLLV